MQLCFCVCQLHAVWWKLWLLSEHPESCCILLTAHQASISPFNPASGVAAVGKAVGVVLTAPGHWQMWLVGLFSSGGSGEAESRLFPLLLCGLMGALALRSNVRAEAALL